MHQTTIRFGPDVWSRIESEARASGVSAAQFVRDAVLARLVRGPHEHLSAADERDEGAGGARRRTSAASGKTRRSYGRGPSRRADSVRRRTT
jgi:hypothetical protein